MLLAEEDFRAQLWEEVRAVAHRVVTSGRRARNHGWDRALHAAADPLSGHRPPRASDAVGRSWDRALASYAIVERRSIVDREGRMIVRRPGGAGRAHENAIAASWDAALAPYAAANGEPPQ